MPFWYRPVTWAWLLLPLALLFKMISFCRRLAYQKGFFKRYKSKLPVIIVGNISVGGNGKTPFVIWLCEMLITVGYKPAVISRGYGGKSNHYPLLVGDHIKGHEAGDEPVLIHKRLGIPVVVDPNRKNAVKYIEQHFLADIIISDDGLQHYALQRDIEIVIVDGKRRFGNQHLMPIGPLRENLSRLNSVDFVVNNGGQQVNEITMLLKAQNCQRVDGETAQLSSGVQVNACAAIGYPQRFFDTLNQQQFEILKAVGFNDHHAFSKDDFTQFEASIPLLMTEKDAVKCTDFAQPNWWYLPVSAEFSAGFEQQLLNRIKEIKC
ncbi:lipid-A-disaccharide kinase [Psychromonas ingrahamii 37]|uniref:Tetraacyldisaccharide 4'-kinase n=1 Tax=Psychromonas ingrahamii (strain DSM 17664 / CCUG 51855 / 37) TaxID=357804 RepID=LPXK_PSYIN|nr:tetraacyldisaccharide 4'-kinase [Psychromonas ingrahamii]A1STC8.1 RecName: Full=Tetraacyldisaccharide 4'-kinase; AltName: Full=Lipid A 4'-kinase [Psychromonas ingrahamii 37]ABM02743.1 lipid-A-disaccharide kinase [Psychromonas ingrahamii 37]